MTFEEWYRQEHPMPDDTFELVIKDSAVYKAMERAWDAGCKQNLDTVGLILNDTVFT